ncbi:MAG: hypothetical protein GAK30_00530 [Paracidovorax wautersii]|uniref:Zinc finger CHCC-type domain-containing protein n=1 Tax=Paracidovorax wautersii TaxID=1177982 RepID=A0A7V8FRI8_9BURK|nr:MAG: hypothetical protein GAK30_00530 [Paracidovorax wautersii]
MTAPTTTAPATAASSTPARPPAPVIELTAKEIHQYGGVFCPNPKAGMKIWNNHPRVFIEVAHAGEGKCPYCGTVYRLQAGEVLKGH